MFWFRTSPAIDALDLAGPHQGWAARFFDWVASARSHRVILLVLCIWLLNAFDLAFTVYAHQQGMLHEANPVARGMLQGGTVAIMLYKVGLVLIGSYPLMRFRTTLIAELGAFCVLAVYAFLAFHWQVCTELNALISSGGITLTELESVTSGSPH